jgi:hypothetical protein
MLFLFILLYYFIRSKMEIDLSTEDIAIQSKRMSNEDVQVVWCFLVYIAIIVFAFIISFHFILVAIVGPHLTFYLRR